MPTPPTRPDIPLDENEVLALVAPVRASLRPAERAALIRDDYEPDLDALILYALGCVLSRSRSKKRAEAYLTIAAKNFLKNTIRDSRRLKRRAVTVSLDNEDAPLVIADLDGTPLDHLLAKDAVDARINGRAPIIGARPKPLAAASARLRRLAQTKRGADQLRGARR
jgi:hypothetical protein